MARGWESKSVEEQQSEFKNKVKGDKSDLSQEKRAKLAERKRLELARVNVANQLKQASNPRYVEMLKKEIADLDQKITELK